MYHYRGPRDIEALYDFASTTFWKSKDEDIDAVPIRQIEVREEYMTAGQLAWKRLCDVDQWVDGLLEGSDFDVIPKPIRYTFLLFVIVSLTASVVFVAFFDDHSDLRQQAKMAGKKTAQATKPKAGNKEKKE